MWAAEEDSEPFRMGRVCIDKLTAERWSLPAGTDQAKAERDTFSARIREF